VVAQPLRRAEELVTLWLCVAPLRLGGLRGKKSTPSVWLGGTGESSTVGTERERHGAGAARSGSGTERGRHRRTDLRQGYGFQMVERYAFKLKLEMGYQL
jgi:hypothetical protein